MAEKEYIEREAVLQHKRKMSGADWSGPFWDEAVLCEEIRKLPAADVVEVVRCKDCKYCSGIREPYLALVPGELVCVRFTYMHSTKPNDYCSHGERKE